MSQSCQNMEEKENLGFLYLIKLFEVIELLNYCLLPSRFRRKRWLKHPHGILYMDH